MLAPQHAAWPFLKRPCRGDRKTGRHVFASRTSRSPEAETPSRRFQQYVSATLRWLGCFAGLDPRREALAPLLADGGEAISRLPRRKFLLI
jgi:hypothetical protein